MESSFSEEGASTKVCAEMARREVGSTPPASHSRWKVAMQASAMAAALGVLRGGGRGMPAERLRSL